MLNHNTQNKLCLLKLYPFSANTGGMHEYYKIFLNGYKGCNWEVLEGPLLKKENYWLLFLKILLRPSNNSFTKNLIEYFKSNNVEFLHITDCPIYTYLLIKRLQIFNTKIVVTLHDPTPHIEKKIAKRIIRQLVIFYYNKLIALSCKVDNLFIHVHSLKLIPNNISNGNFIVEPHPNSIINRDVKKMLPYQYENGLHFAFIGRIEYYKGIDILIEALKIIDKKLSHKDFFTVIIAGKGELYNLDSNFTNINLLIINRYLGDNEFDSIIKYSDCIVLPYREATQSGVISRAISFEIPVICTNQGVLSDYVSDNFTGLISLPEPERIAESLIKIIKNRELLKQFKINLKKHKLNFESETICRNIIKKICEHKTL